jgi:type II secretory pathway component GspD/PulD (secretin)
MNIRLLMTVPAMLLAIAAVFGMDRSFADDGRVSVIAASRQDRAALTLASEGIRMIRDGDFRMASQLFNAALKFEPENAHLHFLNGVAYHLLFSQGHQANRDLAETAYSLALKLTPDHALSAYYLGLLHLDSRNYVKAQAALAHVLLLERDDPAALQALAVSSYYARDIGMALWAIERVDQTQDVSADVLRASAIIHAAAGRFESALTRTDQLRKTAGIEAGDHVAKRVRQWLAFHDSNRGKLYRTANETIPLSPQQASPPPAASPAPSSVPSPAAAQVPTQVPSPAVGTASPGGEILKNWSDCPQGSAVAANSSSYGSSGSGVFQDETAQLPALPSPCDKNALPRMALLDTAIISTVESLSTSKGINLLDGLRIMLGASLNDVITNNNSPTVSSRVRAYTRTASLDNLGGAAGALAYSLNIANAGSDWNQVLARPTLVALDRQPSTFFSGTSLSTTVAGNISGGTLVEHPAGISLSVTPTFVNSETVLLSVRVARSFFPTGTNDLRASTVVKTRNSVSASVLMKIGETLIISGLTERQLSESESGVPLLKNIPLIQYLFSTETTTDNTQSVLVMITPRQPATGVNASMANRESGADPVQRSSLKELRQHVARGQNPAPNLDITFQDMEDNLLFRQFRSGDIRAEDWRRPPFIERTLKQIAQFIYY